MVSAKFYLRDEAQMMVEWNCPSCGSPTNLPVADADYDKFHLMYKHFHPLEKLCPACVMEIARVANRKVLSSPPDVLA